LKALLGSFAVTFSWSESLTIAVSEDTNTPVEACWSAAFKKNVNEQRAENNSGVFLTLIKVFLATLFLCLALFIQLELRCSNLTLPVDFNQVF